MIGKIAIIGSTGVLGTKLLLYLKKIKKKLVLLVVILIIKSLLTKKN